jgi:hypothetical protein
MENPKQRGIAMRKFQMGFKDLMEEIMHTEVIE